LCISLLSGLVFGTSSAQAAPVVEVVSQFDSPAEINRWFALTDRVRPERATTGSTAALVQGPAKGAVFQGELVIEQGAGFASIRRRPDTAAWSAASFDRVMVEVKGDGRQYTILLKDPAALAGDYSYQADWKTTGGRDEVMAIPLDSFVPIKRGRSLPSAPAIDLKQIVEVGVQVSDGQPGPFSLEMQGFWFEQ
jgi:hypothetical protein